MPDNAQSDVQKQRPSRSSIRERSVNGFTLIELLVTIAIIALLATLISPVVGRAIAVAKRTACASNLSQIGQAITMYASENKGFYPGGIYGPATSTFLAWNDLLVPYDGRRLTETEQKSHGFSKTKSSRVYVCPNFETKTNFMGTPITWATTNYAMPRVGGRGIVLSTEINVGIKMANVSQVQAPATTLLLVERNVPGSPLGVPPGICDQPFGGHTGQVGVWPGRNYPQETLHDGKWNYLFCDGRVAALPPEATVGSGTLASPRGMWTRDPED